MAEGVFVDTLTPSLIADKAGMKAGDILLRGSGKALATIDDLRKLIQAAKGKTKFVARRS